jgi:hypothetical protein
MPLTEAFKQLCRACYGACYEQYGPPGARGELFDKLPASAQAHVKAQVRAVLFELGNTSTSEDLRMVLANWIYVQGVLEID